MKVSNGKIKDFNTMSLNMSQEEAVKLFDMTKRALWDLKKDKDLKSVHNVMECDGESWLNRLSIIINK